MAIRVKDHEGRIVEFPDGTPQDVIENAMLDHFYSNSSAFGQTDGAPKKGALRNIRKSLGTQSDLDKLDEQGTLGQLAGRAAIVGDAGLTGMAKLGDMGLGALGMLGDAFIDSVKSAGSLLPFANAQPIPAQSSFVRENTPSLVDAKEKLLDPALQSIGVADVNPNELQGMDRINYLAAENLIPSALTYGALAPKAAEIARTTAAGAAGNPVMDIGRRIQAAPIRTSIEEIASGLGSATAINSAEEMNLGPLGQMAAALFGGLAPGILVEGGFSAADALTGVTQQRQQARLVQDAALSPKLAASRIYDDLRIADANDITPPSAFLSSDDEGLIAMDRALRSKPDVLPQITARDRQMRSDMVRRVDDLRPDADALAPQRLATNERLRMLENLDAQRTAGQRGVEAAEQARNTVAAPIAVAKDTVADASRALDDVVVNKTLVPRRAERNRLFDAIDPDATVRVSDDAAAELRALADDVLREGVSRPGMESRTNPKGPIAGFKRLLGEADDATDGGGIGDVLTALAGDAADDTPPLTYADLQRARGEIAALIRDGNIGVDGSKAPVYVQKLKRLKSALDNLDPNALDDPDAVARAAGAMDYHKSEFAPFFGRGAGKDLRKALDNTDVTRSGVSPADTAARFFLRTGRNAEDAAADLRQILSIAPDEQSGMDAVRQYMFASAARTLDKNGNVNPARMNAWLSQNNGALRAFPEIEQELRGVLRSAVNADKTASEAGDALRRIQSQARLTEAEFNKSAASIFLNNDPMNAVKRIMGASDRAKAMGDAVALVSKDPAAKEGFKAAVADWVKESISGTAGGRTADDLDPILAGATTKILRQHRNTLSKVFTEDELKSLDDINSLLRTAARVENARPSMQSVTAEIQSSQLDTTLLESVLKAKYGVLKGGGIMRIIGRLAGRAQELTGTSPEARAAQYRAFLADVAADPRKAATLLNYEDTKAWEEKIAMYFAALNASEDFEPE